MAGELARALVAALLASSLGAGRGWGCRGSVECQGALQTDVQMLQTTRSSESSRDITFTFQLEVRRKWRSGTSIGDQMAIANGLMSELESEAQAHMQGYSDSYGAASVSGGVSVVMPAPDTGKDWVFVLLPVSGVPYSAARADLGMQAIVLAALKGEALAFEGDSRLTESWGNALPLKLFIGQGDTRPTAASRGQAVIGRGDPHLINVRGQRFDLYQPGVHVLLQVPRGAAPNATKLRLQARAEKMGAKCSDMYFQAINLTGQWVEDELYYQSLNLTAGFLEAAQGARGSGNVQGGLRFFAESADRRRNTPWMDFGGVGVKVVWGHTGGGIKYLNVLLRHVSKAGSLIGGLLGGDDHTFVSTPSKMCSHATALWSGADTEAYQEPDVPSTHGPSIATWE